ncbi:MAG: CRTAC1 family protein [Planctomycetaceae bacterium]|jgi:enediyne biosynthesis protein E4|nr:CRTAC1 family protein [Planctomycetaceae bacterium]MDG2389121.1 CRTAC1 family protein [Planctomycetaceae bacterium]
MNDTHQQPEQDDAIIGTVFVGSLIVFAVLGIGGFLAFQYLKPMEELIEIDNTPTKLPSIAEAEDIKLPEIRWTDITKSAGIDFLHQNGAAGEKLLPETMGGGCAFFDFDNDRDQDLIFINSQRWPWADQNESSIATMKLYANDGSGNFTDVTSLAGLDISLYGMGVACGDFDADGWVDLFISCLGEDRLLRNDEGKFVDVTEQAGVGGEPESWSTSSGWFDYDRDGDLDLFVAHYVVWSRDFDLSQEFTILGNIPAYGRPQNFEGTFPSLYRNDGRGKFIDVSDSAGLRVLNPATQTPLAKSLGVVFEDFDTDEDLDIFVSNDTVQNFLFVNQGDGRFVEMATLAGVAFDLQGAARGAMGIDTSHFRNDPTIGVAIGNFANEMTALYVTRDNNLQFYDEAVSNGLGSNTRMQLSFSVLFFDADLDGRLDLLQTNGHLEEQINKVQASQTYEQAPQLFWNSGPENETEFVALPANKTGDDFLKPLVGRGAAYADIDNDGDLDLVLTATGQPARLIRNDQQLNHHWLRVKLTGNGQNLAGIGATITMSTKGRQQFRTVSPTRGYLSQMELPVTFGLGDADLVERLTIRWPDGTEQILENIEADQLLEVEQP